MVLALASLPINLDTQWWRKRNMHSPWNILLVQLKVLHWASIRPPSSHLAIFAFLIRLLTMSMGICAICNIMHCIHMQLSSLSEFHTLVSTGSILSQQWSLLAGCRIYNYDLVFQYDVIRFLGLKCYQNSRGKCWFIKTEMEGVPFFENFPGPTKIYVNLMH